MSAAIHRPRESSENGQLDAGATKGRPTGTGVHRPQAVPPGIRLKDWPAPRGPRDPITGRWRWSLESRPPDSYSSPVEASAVAAYQHVIDNLRRTRMSHSQATLRFIQQAARIPHSTLTEMENGSLWPAMLTLGRLAQRLGYRLEVLDDRDLLTNFSRGVWQLAPRDHVREVSLRRGIDGMVPTTIRMLLADVEAATRIQQLTAAEVAKRTGVPYSTVCYLLQAGTPKSLLDFFEFPKSPNAKTVFALMAAVNIRPELVAVQLTHAEAAARWSAAAESRP